MTERVQNSPNLIFPVCTQIVSQKPVQGSNGNILHPLGAVGVVVRSPMGRQHAYRVRFSNGFEAAMHHNQLVLLAELPGGKDALNDLLVRIRLGKKT